MRQSRGWMIGGIALVSLLAWGLAMAAQDEMCVPMGEIAIESISQESQRSAVSFPHAVHFGYNCQQCHHTWDNSTPIAGCSTSGCHDLAEAPKTEDGRMVKDPLVQIKYYKNAYHTMCIGCHKSIKTQNKAMEASKMALGEKLMPTGPTGCIECHPSDPK